MSNLKRNRGPTRSARGSLGAVMLAGAVLIVLLISVLAVEFAHTLAVQNELQNSTDAGALAGAHDLWTDLANCEANARAVTAMNKADGHAVVEGVSGTRVSVQVTPPTPLTPGSVEVAASMPIRHLIAPLLGRFTDVVSATSVAGTSGQLFQLFSGQGFPLVPSLTAVPRQNGVDGTPLYQRRLGDTVTFYINSQQVKNAAFTSFTESSANANYIKSAISQALGLSPEIPGFIPAVSIGDEVNLNNGVVGQQELAKDPLLSALTAPDRVLVLPVITGDPAFNQSRPVVGFIGFQVTSVTFGQGRGIVETITGRLVAPQVNGMSGPAGNTGDAFNDAALQSFVPGPIQLIR